MNAMQMCLALLVFALLMVGEASAQEKAAATRSQGQERLGLQEGVGKDDLQLA